MRCTKEELEKFIGMKLIQVEEFDTGSFDSGCMLIFEDGKGITGQDGEYGDNALSVLTAKDIEQNIADTIKSKKEQENYIKKRGKIWIV